MTNHASPSDAGRVLGWDLLRGFCAFAVLAYHLLMWQGLAEVHTFGTYGVYIFFVLSGASLAYAYRDAVEEKRFAMRHFLLTRYARLAPLYLVLMFAVLPWKVAQGGWSSDLVAKVLSNLALAHGFYNPAANSMLIGGWSLGIEAIFYLLFPLLIAVARTRAAVFLFTLAVLIQFAWIATVFRAPGGYDANFLLYHQAPAFVAYFVGGVLLGLHRRRHPQPTLPARTGVLLILGAFGLLALLNTPNAGDQLVGARGLLLFSLCFVLVWLSGAVALKSKAARRTAEVLGDATYGVYLIHPVVFYGLAFAVLPRLGLPQPSEWATSAQLLLVVFVAGASFLLALASEQHFERRVRQKVRMWLSRRPGFAAGRVGIEYATLGSAPLASGAIERQDS